MKRLFPYSIFSIGVLLVLVYSSAAEAQTRFSGKRAIFDEGIGWTTKEGADQTLRRIQEAGFNVYIPCVWHGRGTSWPSKLAPWDFYLKGHRREGHDPLGYLVKKAHELGIEVYPWFTVTLRQSDLFPKWAPPGTPENAFDIHDERFRKFITDLILEVVQKYDVDGINLDYIRTMGMCLSESCVEEYERTYSREFTPDWLLFKMFPGRVPSMIEWQERAVSTLVEAISSRIRKEKPDILISADVAPDVLSLVQGQNSIEWANKGWVDLLFRMDYFRNIDIKLTDSIKSRLKNRDSLTLLISNNERIAYRKGASRDGRWLRDTITMIQDRWPNTGIGIYLYSMLTNEQISALQQGPFAKKLHAGGGMPSIGRKADASV